LLSPERGFPWSEAFPGASFFSGLLNRLGFDL
jgi:hypothetical protein